MQERLDCGGAAALGRRFTQFGGVELSLLGCHFTQFRRVQLCGFESGTTTTSSCAYDRYSKIARVCEKVEARNCAPREKTTRFKLAQSDELPKRAVPL
jgi:hypothetical protein